MSETFVSKTVSLKLNQVQWLIDRYGNVTTGIQAIINNEMENEHNENSN